MPADIWYSSRVTENLKREILWVITNRVNDPRLETMITVPTLKLAKDTRNATVYVSIFADDQKRKETLDVLNHAAPFIQNMVAQRVKIKHLPRLCFKLDTTFEVQDSINGLLDKVKDDLGTTEESRSSE